METYATYQTFSTPRLPGTHFKLTSSQKFSIFALTLLLLQLLLDWGVPVESKKETYYMNKVFVNAVLFAYVNPIVIIFSSEAIFSHCYQLYATSISHLLAFKTSENVKNKIAPEKQPI